MPEEEIKEKASRSALARAILPLAIIAVAVAVWFIWFRGDKGPQFSGERAMVHVENIVGFGPRPAGSEALEESRQYIEEQLAAAGWEVQRQSFTKTTKLKGKVQFTNLRARLKGSVGDWEKGGGMVLVASHYDTKWFEKFEFVGANDGGSSTGVLIELAYFLAAHHPSIAAKVEFVFFDGEEAFGENITDTDGLYGSHYYSRSLWRPKKKTDRPSYGILLDMIGDKDLVITPPRNSGEGLVPISVEVAKELGYGDHLTPGKTDIIDDHVPLNTEAYVPTIDLIDFTYERAWHKKYDRLDQLSAESLEIAGRITVGMLKKLLGEGED